MAIRLFNLNKWVALKGGDEIPFPAARPRKVIIEFNAPTQAVLFITEDGKEPFPVGLVGRDKLEFAADGGFTLGLTEGVVYVYSDDGAQTKVRKVSEETFTVLHDRLRRDPQAEYMAYVARINAEAMGAQIAAQFERKLEAKDRELARITAEQARKDAEAAAQQSAAGGTQSSGTAPAGDGTGGSAGGV